MPVLRTLGEQAAAAHTAVITVDMLRDFFDPDGAVVRDGGRDPGPARAMLPRLARLLDGARRAGVTVAHAKHTTAADGSTHTGAWLFNREKATRSTIAIGVPGTRGAELVPELGPAPGDLVVIKYRYSGLRGNNIADLLRARGVRTLVCTGCSTNACVEAPWRDALEEGFYVVVPEDCVASWSPTLHAAALENVRHRYGIVCPSDDLLALWSVVPSSRAFVSSGSEKPTADSFSDWP